MTRHQSHRATSPVTRRPVHARAITFGLFPSTDAVIETVGRVSGRRRRTAVGTASRDTFWLVAEHGDAQYVQNLRGADVRVLVGRRWHRAPRRPPRGRRARRAELDRGRGLFRRSTAGLPARATRPLTIRIDLEPA